MKEKCDDKEWKDCRVEKMGCDGCYYFHPLYELVDGPEIDKNVWKKKGKQYMKQKSNSNFSIIENTQEAQDEYGHNYGSDTYYISKEDIQALLDGKQLACDINGNEYSLFIALKEE